MTHQSYKRHFNFGNMSSTPHSSLAFPTPKLLLATTAAFRFSDLQPQKQDLELLSCFSPCSECPSNPGVLLSMEALHPPVNQAFPFLRMRPWSCVAAYPTWTSSFCMCLLCDWRHLKNLANMSNRPLPLQSRGGLPTAVQNLGSNSHLKDRWIKKCNRHCCWK